ncbi:MAG: ABC transporter permease [Phycisphaerales bacterium]|nr:ABC transporter permease [Phycisphaerales bacterium]
MPPTPADIPPPTGRSAWHTLLARPRSAIALSLLTIVLILAIGSLPWMLAGSPTDPTPRYNTGALAEARLPPSWSLSDHPADSPPTSSAIFRLLGTDTLGRSLLYRSLTGGAISLTVGLAAALISVLIGTAYGAISALAGGRIDGIMMRAVDVLYGLPYILLVVLLAVAVDSAVERLVVARVQRTSAIRAQFIESELAKLPADQRADPMHRDRLQREAILAHGTGELSMASQNAVNIITLLAAIGSVSWLTMARVVRGEVLSLKARPFVEAARALGVPPTQILLRHILPNLIGPIVVYATLTVPQAILQESFLSFLGIGIRPPLPSWGNLAAEGLSEINPYKSHWWLLAFPCLMLAGTLICLNIVGDALRDALDPRSRNRRA